MKKKIRSLLVKNKKAASFAGLLIAVILTGIAASNAFFKDSETSGGNKFVAGKLNLKIDNTCHYNGKVCSYNENLKQYLWEGTEEECFCTWEKKDLANELFFNFPDIKPGDWGEDTVSLHIEDNDAWVCAQIAGVKSDDNGCESPESRAGDTNCGDPGTGEGELQNYLLFTVWKDIDCNNILDDGETVMVNALPVTEGNYAIADAATGTGPVKGNETACLGISWKVDLETSNIIQSDSLEGDVIFTAVQSRHMGDFRCSGSTPLPTSTPVPGQPTPTPTLIPTSTPVAPTLTPTPSAENCSDGIDNDQDGSKDCLDSDCTNAANCQPGLPWINEIHYQNTGTDTNEGVEIAGIAGTSLTGWKLYGYNGGDSGVYDDIPLSGTIPNEESGFGTKWFTFTGLQNGDPDAIALVNPTDLVIQFLSYGGSFTAVGGSAGGMVSINIGITEPGSSVVDHSLQLTGTGHRYIDFTWSGPILNTRGTKNTGQTFN